MRHGRPELGPSESPVQCERVSSYEGLAWHSDGYHTRKFPSRGEMSWWRFQVIETSINFPIMSNMTLGEDCPKKLDLAILFLFPF